MYSTSVRTTLFDNLQQMHSYGSLEVSRGLQFTAREAGEVAS